MSSGILSQPAKRDVAVSKDALLKSYRKRLKVRLRVAIGYDYTTGLVNPQECKHFPENTKTISTVIYASTFLALPSFNLLPL